MNTNENWTRLRLADVLTMSVADVLTLLGVEIPASPPKEDTPVQPPVVTLPEPAPVPDEPPVQPAEPIPETPPEQPPQEPEAPPIEPPVIVPPVVIPPAEEPPTEPPVLPPVEPTSRITSVSLKNTADTPQQNVPVTFGQVFSEGDLLPTQAIALQAAGASFVPCQMDVKASHKDGSVRHAVLSAILPTLAAEDEYSIVPSSVANGPAPEFSFTTCSEVVIVLDGKRYKVAADSLLDKVDNVWLEGNSAREVHVHSAMIAEDGAEHPHLTARFAIREYANGNSRVDFTMENNWAYEPSPQNFTYDVVLSVAGRVVYEKAALTHLHHARWRNVSWTGDVPAVHVKHDAAYLIASRALPNYDQSVVVPEKTFAEWNKKWDKAGKGPMQVGLSVKGMSTTGGRADIGILPAWSVLSLLTGDEGFKEMTLGTADCAGSWSMHYRDRDTDQPISLLDYPYMTINGNPGDTGNPLRIDPVTKKPTREAFPEYSKKANPTPYAHDTSHQPGFSYLPYLFTGDHYYLEELQFWAMWNLFQSNPGYRKNIGVWAGQVRGTAWTLRTLGEAAYITPDNDRLKEHFLSVLKHNMELGNKFYAHDPRANQLGIYTANGAVVYRSKTAIGTFQDEFLTAGLGSLVEKGFEEARPLLEWKARFPVERMVGEGANWLAAATYAFPVYDSDYTMGGKEFTTIKDAYASLLEDLRASTDEFDIASLARITGEGADMGGYPLSTEGFCANLQPALAYAAPLSEKGREAWEQFQKREPKPNYGTGPQFAITPRWND